MIAALRVPLSKLITVDGETKIELTLHTKIPAFLQLMSHDSTVDTVTFLFAYLQLVWRSNRASVVFRLFNNWYKKFVL